MCGIGESLARDETEAAPAPWLVGRTRASAVKSPRILRLVDHYPPAYKAGGPLRDVSNLVELLCDEFEFWVVTREPSARLARALLSLVEPFRTNHEEILSRRGTSCAV